MHFHLPKPLHGWRPFAGEVGIIVRRFDCASAQQVAQNIRTGEARDASQAIGGELEG
jgi:hypothetical protein